MGTWGHRWQKWEVWTLFVLFPIFLACWGGQLLVDLLNDQHRRQTEQALGNLFRHVMGEADATSMALEALRAPPAPGRTPIRWFPDSAAAPSLLPLNDLAAWLKTAAPPAPNHVRDWKILLGWSFEPLALRSGPGVPYSVLIGSHPAHVLFRPLASDGRCLGLALSKSPAARIKAALARNLPPAVRFAVSEAQSRRVFHSTTFSPKLLRTFLTPARHLGQVATWTETGYLLAGASPDGGLLLLTTEDTKCRLRIRREHLGWAALGVLFLFSLRLNYGSPLHVSVSLSWKTLGMILLLSAGPLAAAGLFLVVVSQSQAGGATREHFEELRQALLEYDRGFGNERRGLEKRLRALVAGIATGPVDVRAIGRGVPHPVSRFEILDDEGTLLYSRRYADTDQGFERLTRVLEHKILHHARQEAASASSAPGIRPKKDRERKADPGVTRAGDQHGEAMDEHREGKKLLRSFLTDDPTASDFLNQPENLSVAGLLDTPDLGFVDFLLRPEVLVPFRTGGGIFSCFFTVLPSRGRGVPRLVFAVVPQEAMIRAYVRRSLVANRPFQILVRDLYSERWFPRSPSRKDLRNFADGTRGRERGRLQEGILGWGEARSLVLALDGLQMEPCRLVALKALQSEGWQARPTGPLFMGGLSLSLVSGWLAVWILSRALLQPVKQIEAGIEALRAGQFDLCLPELGSPELEGVRSSLNRLLETHGEMRTAEGIQQLLFHRPPEKWAGFHTRFEVPVPLPDEVFYDFQEISGDRALFFGGWVSLEGTGALLARVMLKTLISWEIDRGTPADKLFERLEQRLGHLAFLPGPVYLTAILCQGGADASVVILQAGGGATWIRESPGTLPRLLTNAGVPPLARERSCPRQPLTLALLPEQVLLFSLGSEKPGGKGMDQSQASWNAGKENPVFSLWREVSCGPREISAC